MTTMMAGVRARARLCDVNRVRKSAYAKLHQTEATVTKNRINTKKGTYGKFWSDDDDDEADNCRPVNEEQQNCRTCYNVSLRAKQSIKSIHII